MNIKVGCDIVDINRVSEWQIKKPELISRVLWDKEIERDDPEHIAGLIAAKEAALKALSLSTDHWKDILIQKNQEGKPCLIVNHTISERIMSSNISISHDGNIALAVAVMLIE
jgi:phosphopantetheine--protein transferase-like protein